MDITKKIIPAKSRLMEFESDAKHLFSHGWHGSQKKYIL
jgi:hypothetical protein